jgi:hypothetical protein
LKSETPFLCILSAGRENKEKKINDNERSKENKKGEGGIREFC